LEQLFAEWHLSYLSEEERQNAAALGWLLLLHGYWSLFTVSGYSENWKPESVETLEEKYSLVRKACVKLGLRKQDS
jgi:hypothetical protein